MWKERNVRVKSHYSKSLYLNYIFLININSRVISLWTIHKAGHRVVGAPGIYADIVAHGWVAACAWLEALLYSDQSNLYYIVGGSFSLGNYIIIIC